jgi:hypothetical protein
MPAIKQGVAQGKGVGKLIIRRLKTRNEEGLASDE